MSKENHFKYKGGTGLTGGEDIGIFQPGDYGSVECESSFFNKLPDYERDLIVICERCYVKIINFDPKDSFIESNFDLINFSFSKGSPSYDLRYFIRENDSYLYVISDNEILSGVKIENFKINRDSKYKDSIKFINSGFPPQHPEWHNINEDEKDAIVARIDHYIENGYNG